MADDQYTRLAAEHLPEELAERWTALLRPCIRLRPAKADEQNVAATLGGNPELPAGYAWPEWPERGPLSFVASVNCAALPSEGLSEHFPQDGTLLFFYYDAFIAESQVLYVAENTPVSPADPPQGVEIFMRVDLVGKVEQSAPDNWLPEVRRVLLGDDRAWPHPRDTPQELKPFLRAFARQRTEIGHQIGGHAMPIQGPVEHEIAKDDAESWVLLAQIDSDEDAEMSWGDTGALYWLIRAEDLAARRFDQVRTTIQC